MPLTTSNRRTFGAQTSPHVCQFQDLMGPKLEAIFKQFDADGNGTLDASELKAAFEAAGRPAEEETIQNAIKKLDTDGDGVISLEEFKAIAWQCSVDGG